MEINSHKVQTMKEIPFLKMGSFDLSTKTCKKRREEVNRAFGKARYPGDVELAA